MNFRKRKISRAILARQHLCADRFTNAARCSTGFNKRARAREGNAGRARYRISLHLGGPRERTGGFFSPVPFRPFFSLLPPSLFLARGASPWARRIDADFFSASVIYQSPSRSRPHTPPTRYTRIRPEDLGKETKSGKEKERCREISLDWINCTKSKYTFLDHVRQNVEIPRDPKFFYTCLRSIHNSSKIIANREDEFHSSTLVIVITAIFSTLEFCSIVYAQCVKSSNCDE